MQAFDPQTMDSARSVFGDQIDYAPDQYAALEGAADLVIATEWLVFRNPDFERVRSTLAGDLTIGARNLYEPETMRRLGFTYLGMGR